MILNSRQLAQINRERVRGRNATTATQLTNAQNSTQAQIGVNTQFAQSATDTALNGADQIRNFDASTTALDGSIQGADLQLAQAQSNRVVNPRETANNLFRLTQGNGGFGAALGAGIASARADFADLIEANIADAQGRVDTLRQDRQNQRAENQNRLNQISVANQQTNAANQITTAANTQALNAAQNNQNQAAQANRDAQNSVDQAARDETNNAFSAEQSAAQRDFQGTQNQLNRDLQLSQIQERRDRLAASEAQQDQAQAQNDINSIAIANGVNNSAEFVSSGVATLNNLNTGTTSNPGLEAQATSFSEQFSSIPEANGTQRDSLLVNTFRSIDPTILQAIDTFGGPSIDPVLTATQLETINNINQLVGPITDEVIDALPNVGDFVAVKRNVNIYRTLVDNFNSTQSALPEDLLSAQQAANRLTSERAGRLNNASN